MSEHGRSPAEWVTFAACSIVLLVVVGVIVGQMRGPRDPAAPVAEVVGAPRHVGSQYQLDVTVTNEGDVTAANVQVNAELEIDGESPTSADQTIDFLAGSEHQDLVFVFADDPAGGDVTVEVAGFAVP